MSTPTPRDAPWLEGHRALVERARRGGVDLYFIGDSITRRWEADYRDNWDRNLAEFRPGNFGMGGDCTEHVLYRIEHGALDGIRPRAIVLLIGTNDVGFEASPSDIGLVERVSAGIAACAEALLQRAPNSKLLLVGVTARNTAGTTSLMPTIHAVNERISSFADGERVRFLDINDRLADPGGKLNVGTTLDGLHLTERGYQVWADAMRPTLAEWFQDQP